MDQTVTQQGTVPPKTVETGIQSGSPPNKNGSALETPEGPTKPVKAPKHPARQLLETLASLRITVALFALSMVLVFYGTLAQVDNGVWTIVSKYFRSAIVLIPLKVLLLNSVDETSIVLPFPGGWLLGGAMLLNLLAAHAIRFKLAWNRAGILMIHAGLIIIMLGEVVTGVFAVEGQMLIQIGQTINYVIEPGQPELAIVRTIDAKNDDVVVVLASRLKNGAVIEDEKLPFKIEVVQYMVNSDLLDFKEGMSNPATKGFGRRAHVARELTEVSGVDMNQRHDAPSAYLKLTSKKGEDLGTWLYSVHFDQPQWIQVGNDKNKYQISLRFKQRERPFSFHLTNFKHDLFPGTDKPRDFHSYVHLTDPSAEVERDVEIYMNEPLRYRGETFYQSSWTTDPRTGKANGTILQVVRNPGWLMPYIACVVVGLGMLIHFGANLYRFVERRRVQ